MIFNHNIVERSRRLIFDEGFQNTNVVGGWEDTDTFTSEDNLAIGETISIQDVSGANPRVCSTKAIDVTNIKSINFRLHDIATNVSVLADVYIGLCKVNTFSGIADALNNTNRYKAVHYNDANVFVPETVLTLDVSDYIGEYYIFITFNGWAGDILQISRIWTE